MQTQEDRIRLHYKAKRHMVQSRSELFMYLAQWWKRPIREIKKIVGYKQNV